MKNKEVIFLSGNGNHALGREILINLSETLGEKCSFDHINYSKFQDGELDNRIPLYKKVKGKTVVFYQSIYNQDLATEALDLIWALKHQYGAKYIIGVFPFMLYRRQDPKMEINPDEFNYKEAKPDEIQRLRMIISILAFCGLNEMLVGTPHSDSMEKYAKESGIIFHEIDVSRIFSNMIQTLIKDNERNLIRVYSPDWGSVPRAIKVAKILNCPVLFNLKDRKIDGETKIVEAELKDIEDKITWAKETFDFEEIYYATHDLVAGMIIIMMEDEVATGGTANDTGLLLRKYLVKDLYFLATHPVLTLGWRNKLLKHNPFTKIVFTNTIPRTYEKQTGGEVLDLSIAPQFGSVLFKILNAM